MGRGLGEDYSRRKSEYKDSGMEMHLIFSTNSKKCRERKARGSNISCSVFKTPERLWLLPLK